MEGSNTEATSLAKQNRQSFGSWARNLINIMYIWRMHVKSSLHMAYGKWFKNGQLLKWVVLGFSDATMNQESGINHVTGSEFRYKPTETVNPKQLRWNSQLVVYWGKSASNAWFAASMLAFWGMIWEHRSKSWRGWCESWQNMSFHQLRYPKAVVFLKNITNFGRCPSSPQAPGSGSHWFSGSMILEGRKWISAAFFRFHSWKWSLNL